MLAPHTRVIDAFPKRPLQIEAVRCRLALMATLLGLVVAAVAGWNFISVIPDLADDYRLGRSGIISDWSKVLHVSCWVVRGLGTLAICSVTASYQLADGTTPTKDWKYTALFSGLPRKLKFSVRYDPARPARASTSWGEDLLVERTLRPIVFDLPLCCLMTYIFVNPWREWVRMGRKVRTIASDPIPVVATLADTVRSDLFCKGGWLVRFYWSDPTTKQVFFDDTLFKGTPQPFYLNPERTELLALASSSGRAHLLDAGLTNVDLSDRERLVILAARAFPKLAE